MPERAQFSILNRIAALSEAMERVDRFAARQDVPEVARRALMLALEESLANIISHGYTDQNDHNIHIAVETGEQEVRLEVTDSGVPFDLRTLQAPDLSQSIEERQMGGLGVLLIRKMMDEVDYRRDGDFNRLRLVKRWSC